MGKRDIQDFTANLHFGESISDDYAIVHPFPNVIIDFSTTVADGDGEPCRMTFTRAKG